MTTAADSKYRSGCVPASSAIGSHDICMVIPSAPALVKSTATDDQRYAASTPIDTSVSMLVVPCRALTQADRWNGAAPHVTTIVVSRNAIHCQPTNCSGITIEVSTTGTLSTALMRHRRPSSSGSSTASVSGRRTPYPVFSTTVTRSSKLTPAGARTVAVSVA